MNKVYQLVAALAALAAFATGSPALADDAPNPVGDWSGALKTPRGDLTLIVHITHGSGGALAAALESPDQGPGEMQASEITVTGGHLAWKVAAIGASYTGDWDASKSNGKGLSTRAAACRWY